MFILKINKQRFPLPQIFTDDLEQISKIYPFECNHKENFLWNYFRLRKVGNIFEVIFLESLSLQQKLDAFNMLSYLITRYHLSLVGVDIKIDVHSDLQRKMGKVYTKRLICKKKLDIWDFRPDVEFAMPFKAPAFISNEITQIHTNSTPNSTSEFLVLKIPSRWISSLILV